MCSQAIGAHAQDFDKVEIRTTRVAGSVSMLEGQGGNIGVSVGDDGILVMNVSNYYLDLKPVARRLAETIGWTAYHFEGQPDFPAGVYFSEWVIITGPLPATW